MHFFCSRLLHDSSVCVKWLCLHVLQRIFSTAWLSWQLFQAAVLSALLFRLLIWIFHTNIVLVITNRISSNCRSVHCHTLLGRQEVWRHGQVETTHTLNYGSLYVLHAGQARECSNRLNCGELVYWVNGWTHGSIQHAPSYQMHTH